MRPGGGNQRSGLVQERVLCLGSAAVVLTLKSERHLDYHLGQQREKEGLPVDSLLQTSHCEWGSRPYGLTFSLSRKLIQTLPTLKSLNFMFKNENKSWI